MVGHQRQAAGNQGQALGRAYRRFGARPDDSPVDPATEVEVTVGAEAQANDNTASARSDRQKFLKTSLSELVIIW